ncbi:MAG: GGDEF domain-containing protein [Candidatus Aminicenantes bacterium]|nr:GGDEF domain-containing protein [Candidatus Aminicenantes bacterium]
MGEEKGKGEPFLTVIWGTDLDFGKEIQLHSEPVLIGRSKEANFKLTDRMVSRRHCVIRPSKEGFYEIEDVGSSNGTYVNEQRINSRKLLVSGDKIRVGETIIKFHYKDEYDTQFFNRLYKMAIYDGATGLMTKSYFVDELKLQLEIARRHNGLLAFIMMDIDDFKQVNDKYGHPVGDVVLKEVAKIILTIKRSQDIAARYGGEEFSLLLPGTDIEGAVALTERIRKKVDETYIEAFHNSIQVTISAGISCFPITASSLEELIEQADQALYEAKNLGKNKVIAYMPISK